MYLPNSFKIDELEEIHNFISRNSFGILVGVKEKVPEAAHLPFMLDPERGPFGTLIGHVARANKIWQEFGKEQEFLVIFQGPHAYISPSWYEVSPSVPTWNYAAVHAYGFPRVASDPEKVEKILRRLVNQNEAGFEKPWPMELPEDYLQTMLKALVAFELEITRLEGKYKLSQNRPVGDRVQVIARLEKSPDQTEAALAEMMRQHSVPSGLPDTR